MATLLLLDDDLYFRRMVTTCLQSRHEILQASCIKDAEAVLRDRSVALLIVDGLLPDGDGQAFIERLRGHDTKTPVLFISAFWKNPLALARLDPRTGLADVLETEGPGGPRDLVRPPPSRPRRALRLAGDRQRHVRHRGVRVVPRGCG